MKVRITQEFVDNQLQCPAGRTRIEYTCDQQKNFFIEVRANKPGQGSYYVRYRDREDVTRYVRVAGTTEVTLAAARAKARGIQAEIALGRDFHAEAEAKRAVPTVSDFYCQHYLPYIKPRKRSYDRDEEMIRLRIDPRFGSLKMTQVTRKMVQQFHTDLLAQGLKPATADHYLKLMRQSWNLAVEWGMLESSPLTKLALFNPDNRVENLLTDDQLEKLVTVLRTDANRAVCHVCLFLLSTGCRLNEALAATWDQVDVENRVWRIPAQNSKSKRVRSVPLNDSALDVLAQVGTQGNSEYLFLSKHDERFQRIHKQWHRIRKLAGLEFLRLHDLRHGFASFLVNSGRTLYEVQQILGHSDPKVTMRYSHLSSKALQEAANTASLAIQGAMKNSKVQPLALVPKAA